MSSVWRDKRHKMSEARFIDLLDDVINDAKNVAEAYEQGSGMRSAQRILDDSRDAAIGEYDALRAKLDKAIAVLKEIADNKYHRGDYGMAVAWKARCALAELEQK